MKLIEDAKKFTGNVICIGVKNDLLMSILSKNDKVAVFTIDAEVRRKTFMSRKKKMKTKDNRKVNIKKLRKTFKKKSIDNLVYDLNEMYEYFKYFIGDSIIITKGKIYIYGTSRYIDPKVLMNRYKRYGAKTFLEVNGDSFTIVVDASKSKTNWFKNKFYLVVDTFHNIGDMISAALIS